MLADFISSVPKLPAWERYMKYERDENKRKINLQNQSLDFIDADLVYESPEKITVVVTREEDDEE